MSKQSRCRECGHTPGPRPAFKHELAPCAHECHAAPEAHSSYGPTPSRRQLAADMPAAPAPRKVYYPRPTSPGAMPQRRR